MKINSSFQKKNLVKVMSITILMCIFKSADHKSLSAVC